MQYLDGLLPFPGSMTDDLRMISARRCDEIAAHAAKALFKRGDVLGVHLFGRIGLPGVSDLDLLVVCEDAAYADVVAHAGRLARADVEVQYLFTHQPFVLPASLMPLRSLLFFEQSLNPVLTLYGDAASALSPQLSAASRRLQDLVWDSTLWRMLWLLRSRPYGVREILLLCQTFARQTDLRALHAGKEAVLCDALGPRRRKAAGLAQQQERVAAASALLADAVSAWADAQWEEQALWPSVQPGPLHIGEAELPFFSRRTAAVPAMHACVGALLRDAFFPHLEQPALAFDVAAPDDLREAFQTYADGVRQAKDWGQAHACGPYALFLGHGKGIFPSPFNLASSTA